MTAMLSVSAAFVSCSDKEVFNQAAVEQAQVEKTEVQYKEAFVKHFGEVNPNQSWDFSQIKENLFKICFAQSCPTLWPHRL